LDALLWTYCNEPRVLVNPHWYGWVATQPPHKVSGISVKQPISRELLRDQVISGTFWFRSAELLEEGIRQLVDSNRRVNGEFYLDSVGQVLLEMGRRVEIFEVSKYIGWGTPDDYEDYQLWSNYVRRRIAPAAA
jgi:bifunctional N-acetylglucosamine-1-phosphate-uridyltransferase/glucosamine-1-phosphate-acetyltransferase GlmU-like protein